MQIPQSPQNPRELLHALSPGRAVEVLTSAIGPEVGGRYLHWDEVRRREPPSGWSHQEWWLGISNARQLLHSRLGLHDKDGQPFRFVRSDSVLRLLHLLDRELGSSPETADPQLAVNKDLRNRYMVESLMEEAITSSQLEGASTTRQVAKAMLRAGRPAATRDERMIANNFQAMEFVRSNLETPLSQELLFELHRILCEGTMDEPDVGRFRRSDENITVQDAGTSQVLWVPPEAKDLGRRVDALCRFANDDADDAFTHPIVRAVALHFMLSYEHPFVDGNGRTARTLFYWSMLRQKYWLTEFVSISSVLRKAKAQYSRAFLYTETDSNDLTYFLLHQFGVIRQALEALRAYLKRKSAEVRQSEQLLHAQSALNPRQRLLVAHALRHPDATYTIDSHRRQYDVVYQTARQDLLDLAAAGLLLQRKQGKAFVFDVPRDLERRLKAARG